MLFREQLGGRPGASRQARLDYGYYFSDLVRVPDVDTGGLERFQYSGWKGLGRKLVVIRS